MSMYRNFGLAQCLRVALFAGLLCGAFAAQAQAPQAEPQLTPEQQAQLQEQDAQMAQAAMSVMQLVDANRVGELWDGASEAMKRLVGRDDFIREVATDRTRLGTPTKREGPVVTRSSSQGEAGVPAGLYINVASSTTFSGQAEPVRELVSFRLDEDRKWRVTGYTLRETQ